ncbi:putative vomeronasal receptor-like protein 4 isoform X1 [Lemur catta]|uniref:putative vomeronasal receptor-like protein 4 isoform X1 n=1 Tax=Lemur catta TaxID=9447 RepID=UPI001E266AF5|nr:putative vomeronasal receptor-like protein 4 isoform X1 [Lemur catta]
MPKPTDVTTSHLAFVHIVNLVTEVILVSLELFESLHFGNDFKCKALLSPSRVMRGLSICTTCLLSMPRPSPSAPAPPGCSNLIIYAVSSSDGTQTNLVILTQYCSLSPVSYIIRGLTVTLSVSRDVSFVGIMLLSNAYMRFSCAEAIPGHSQHQPLPKSLPREKGHPHRPATGDFLCGHVLGGPYHLILLHPVMGM